MRAANSTNVLRHWSVDSSEAATTSGETGDDGLQEHETSNVGRRSIAALVDIAMLVVLYVIFVLAFGQRLHARLYVRTPKPHFISANGHGLSWAGIIAYVLCCFGYFILLEWRFGRTAGKLLFGLRVTTLEEERISLRQAVTRNLLRAVDGLPYVIPYLMGFGILRLSPTKQRLGDRMAGTLVIDSV